MADDALRLQAEVVDKFSGPLKNLQTQLRGISAGPAVKQLKKDLEDVQGHMAKTATVVKDLLNPAMAGFGIAALSVGGTLAGVGAALRGFATDTTALSYLSREVGISAGKLRELQSVAGRFNLDPSSIGKSAHYFADQLDQMHRNRGEAYNYLLQQGAKDPTGNVSRWTQAIKTARSNAEAYQRTLEMIASIKDPLQRGDMAEKLLGDRSLGQLGSEGLGGLHKQMAEARKDLGEFHEGSADAAIAFERSVQSMRDQIRGLRDDLGPDLMQPLNEGLREFGGWLREHKGEIRDGLVSGIKDLRDFFRDTNWKEVVGNLTSVLHGIEAAARATADAIRGIVQAGQDFRASLDRLGITNTTRERRIAEIDKDIGTLQDNRKHAHDGVFGNILGDRAQRDIDAKITALQAEKQRLVEERNTEELKKNTEELKRKREREDRDGDKAKADPSAYDGTAPGDAARILKASFGGGGSSYGGRGGAGGGSPGNGDAGGYGGLGRGHPLRQRGGGLDVPDDAARLRGQGAVEKGQSEREQRVMARLVAHGWTPEAAASAVGQAATESRVRSDGPLGDTQRFGRGDNAAHGMFQWRAERYRALKKFAEARGKPWTDFDTQVDFFDAETKRRSRQELNWRHETDIGRGNATGKVFEGYLGPLQRQRERDGRRIHDAWRRGNHPTVAHEGQPKPAERRADLMGRARAAGLIGGVAKAEGHVQVHVNAPPGWKTKTENKGSLFREVKLNRGNAMQLASQET